MSSAKSWSGRGDIIEGLPPMRVCWTAAIPSGAGVRGRHPRGQGGDRGLRLRIVKSHGLESGRAGVVIWRGPSPACKDRAQVVSPSVAAGNWVERVGERWWRHLEGPGVP